MDHKNNPQVIVKTGFWFAGYDFHDGMAKIEENAIWSGFIDRSGRVVAEPHYSYATEFSEGLAAVLDKDGTAGYIDASGEVVIHLPEDSLGCQFRGGLARILVDELTTKAGKTQHHSEMAYIDRSGKYVVPPSVTPARLRLLPSTASTTAINSLHKAPHASFGTLWPTPWSAIHQGSFFGHIHSASENPTKQNPPNLVTIEHSGEISCSPGSIERRIKWSKCRYLFHRCGRSRPTS